MIKVDVKESMNNFNNLFKGLKFMRDNEVFVGISQDETSREDDPVTNAELLFIHTNGSPINNVPARPVIEPAIKDDRERLSKMMGASAQSAMDGNTEEAMRKLKLAGMRAQNISRAWFTNPKNGWPPNSPSVIRAKMKKGSTDPKPLIDTGELRKSITYFIKAKGGRVK